jgi:hypothetical protein
LDLVKSSALNSYSGEFGDFGQRPGPSSSLLFRAGVLLLLRFCVIIIYCALN